MRLFALALFTFVSGCMGHKAPPPRPIPPTVWIVSAEFLTRDFETADTYRDCRVRVALPPRSYQIAPEEIVVPAHIVGAAPIIVFHCLGTVPRDNHSSCVIVGICRGPTRDGHWRTHRVDFSVSVEECLIVDTLGPLSGAASEP